MKHKVDFNSLYGRNGESSSIRRFHVLSDGHFRGIDAVKDGRGRWMPHYDDEPMSDENFLNHRQMERWLNKSVTEDMIDPVPPPEADLFDQRTFMEMWKHVGAKPPPPPTRGFGKFAAMGVIGLPDLFDDKEK